MQLVKCCLYYLRKEGGKKGSFQTHWPSLLLLLPANVGWVLSFFLFNASAFCCVSKFIYFFRTKKNKQKRIWNSSQSTHSFLFHRPFKFDFFGLLAKTSERDYLETNQIVKYREEEKRKKKNEFLFCFEAVCVDFFLSYFFFWPARPCMGSNSRLTAESVVPPIVYRGSLSFMEHSFSFLIAFWVWKRNQDCDF